MIKAASIPLRSIERLLIETPLAKLSQPEQLTEIRLRAGRQCVAVDIFGEMKPCSGVISAEEIAECFAEICRYSVYSFETEIAQGYITLDGGHRVGICGTAVTKAGKIVSIKDISGLNIRIAHQLPGCADELYKRVFSDGVHSLLLGGRPLSGKTTVLRDLARQLGARHRVVLIDSRGELSASVRGTPSFDIGLNTDALCGCEKSEGIMLALRSLSPEIIICDELGNDETAIEQAMFCGVKLVASAHADSIGQLRKRPSTRGILPFFERVAVLGERGRIIEFLENG